MTHRPRQKVTRLTGILLGLGLSATPATAFARPYQPDAAVPGAAPYAQAATVTQYQDKLAATGLDDPAKKEIAMKLVSSAENSSLDWKAQYKYIEDIDDGRGYTAGIIGFCSGTGDMLELVQLYADRKSGNVLQKYLPALRRVNDSDSHSGLDPNYASDWETAA